jgi:MFS family permease
LSEFTATSLAPGVPRILEDFNSTSKELSAFILSAYVLGRGTSGLYLGPFAELFGRRWTYITCTIAFIVFGVGCALSKNTGMLIVFRFLQGSMATAAPLIGSLIISDITPRDHAKTSIAFSNMFCNIGSVIGPIIGGFLIHTQGWRWACWLSCIVGGLIAIISIFRLSETCSAIILNRMTVRLREETGNQHLRSGVERSMTLDKVGSACFRPVQMIFSSWMIPAGGVYLGLHSGMLYRLLSFSKLDAEMLTESCKLCDGFSLPR